MSYFKLKIVGENLVLKKKILKYCQKMLTEMHLYV